MHALGEPIGSQGAAMAALLAALVRDLFISTQRSVPVANIVDDGMFVA